jgi:hypothetical protein
MSALPLKADMCSALGDVRFVPIADINNKTGSPPYTASDFHCGGNLETPTTVCADVLVKYKHEASSGQLDFTDTGVNRNICGLAGKSADAGK